MISLEPKPPAEDADAEGVEGRFHVWTPQEIEAVLDKETATKYCSVYDITSKGNFEGKNIPNLLLGTLGKIAHDNSQSENDVLRSLETARQILFATREKRIHPHKDDKILTAWNGLMMRRWPKELKSLAITSIWRPPNKLQTSF